MNVPDQALAALAAITLLPLAACSDKSEPDGKQVTEVPHETLTAALAAQSDLAAMADALARAELNTVFDGPGSYTMLAPTNDAFRVLGETGQALMNEDQRPVLVAVIRDHILPGNLTPDAIRDAIEQKGGPVEMTTLGEGTVTFSMEGESVRVSGDDGASGLLLGRAVVAGNGAIIPVDSLIKNLAPAQSAEGTAEGQ